jgi:Protein of unknown function (DUF1217)
MITKRSMTARGAADMSGIVNGMNYSLLFSPNSAADASTAILNALFSGESSSLPTTTFVSSGNAITDLKLAQQEQTAGVAQEALQPQISNAIASFKTAVANATSIQSALANPNVQKVLLTANGLTNYIGETALAQKILLSDPNDSNSLVNKLANPTWLNTVSTYNFAKNGLAELQNPATISALANSYAEVQWRQGLNQATPGLSNALTFLGQASAITSVSDIFDNLTNFQVITTALGIPQDVAFQEQSAQESAVTSRLDISKLQDRSYVTNLTDQYLATMQETSQSSSNSGPDLTTLAVQAQGLVV